MNAPVWKIEYIDTDPGLPPCHDWLPSMVLQGRYSLKDALTNARAATDRYTRYRVVNTQTRQVIVVS